MFSYWQQDSFLAPTDVVIIGAGFAGLWCAYEMKVRQPNLTITVLEGAAFPSGASVRNAGFACFGSPGEMISDAATMGEAAMWQTVARRYRGIQKLRRVLGDAAIDYNPCGGYECFETADTFGPVREALARLNKEMEQVTGAKKAFSIGDELLSELGLQNFRHLLVNRLEGGLHSGKALMALWQKLTGLGVTVLCGCLVNNWETSGNSIRVQVQITEAFSIKTSRLLLATNAHTPKLTDTLAVQPARGQILMTEPIADLPLKGTFHFDEGFYYWRNVGNRILLGGARNSSFASEQTDATDTSETIQQALENFLQKHISLPPRTRVEYRWAGTMGFTETKQDRVQQVDNNVWAVVACNGMGLALTPVIAEEVAGLMLA